jgi:hypothetical protein
MPTEHYFSETPGSQYKPKEIIVEIDGQEVSVLTAGGIFSPDWIDQGTAVLLAHLDSAPPSGNLLDLGCGWGPIALSLAKHSPKSTVWAVDVNERSLELTKKNAERLGLTNIITAKPEDVPGDVSFQGIWSNPPIRVGKAVLHEMLLHWMPRLAPRGESYLVVQKNLGADSLLRWLDAELPRTDFVIRRIDTSKTFRVILVKRAA